MIKKLRRHFILITLISIALVLGVMMSAINIENYHSVNIRADEKISVIADNDGTFPKKSGEKAYKPFDYKMLEKKMTAEAPFDTRYFTVKVTDKKYNCFCKHRYDCGGFHRKGYKLYQSAYRKEQDKRIY